MSQSLHYFDGKPTDGISCVPLCILKVHTFRYFTGTGPDVKVFEQHFLVSDSISYKLPAVVYTRLTNRKILSWVQNETGG